MKAVLSSLLAVTVLFFTAGCGDDGPTGPEDVGVHSQEFVFSMDDAQVNGAVASVQFDVPTITPNVVDNGAVLVYFREQGTWTAMPYTFGVESPDLPAVDYTISLGYGFDDNFLEVFYEASTSEIDLFDQPDRTMKAVIIDGFSLSKSGVDVTDYEAVKAYYGLED